MALLSLVTALDRGFTRDDTALLVMPMCDANSLNFGSTFIYLGATVVVDDRKSFDPEALLATMATQHVTFTSLVPYALHHGTWPAGGCEGEVRREPRAQADDQLGAGAQGHEARDPRPFQEFAALRAVRL